MADSDNNMGMIILAAVGAFVAWKMFGDKADTATVATATTPGTTPGVDTTNRAAPGTTPGTVPGTTAGASDAGSRGGSGGRSPVTSVTPVMQPGGGGAPPARAVLIDRADRSPAYTVQPTPAASVSSDNWWTRLQEQLSRYIGPIPTAPPPDTIYSPRGTAPPPPPPATAVHAPPGIPAGAMLIDLMKAERSSSGASDEDYTRDMISTLAAYFKDQAGNDPTLRTVSEWNYLRSRASNLLGTYDPALDQPELSDSGDPISASAYHSLLSNAGADLRGLNGGGSMVNLTGLGIGWRQKNRTMRQWNAPEFRSFR